MYQTNYSNLFTTLTIGNKNPIKITSGIIIFLIEKIMCEFIDSQRDKAKIQGSGEKESPYFLNNPLAWLLVANDFPIKDKSLEKKYFDLKNWIADVAVQDRYASVSPSADKNHNEFAPFMTDCVQQVTRNLSDAVTNANDFGFVIHLDDKLLGSQPMPLISLGLSFIQTIDAAYIDRETWLESPYSEIAKKHANSRSFIDSNKHKFTTENINEASQKADESFHSQPSSIPMESMPNMISQAVAAVFDNFLPNLNISNDKKILFENTKKSLLKNINDIDLSNANNDSPWNMFLSFATAIFLPSGTDQKESFKSLFSLMKEPTFNAAKNMCEQLREGYFDHVTQSNFLDDTSCASEMRQILHGNLCKAHTHLPILTIALFFAEASRYSPTFISTLMLLDLIQMQAVTPDKGAPYSIQNLMSNPNNRHVFVDAYGVHYGNNKGCKDAACLECQKFRLYKEFVEQEKTALKNDLNGFKKSDLKNLYLELDIESGKTKIIGKNVPELASMIANRMMPINPSELDLGARIAGYHPMVHGGSYDQVKHITKYNQLEIAHQKTASIILQWLAIQLENDGYEVSLGRDILKEEKGSAENNLALSNKLKFYFLDRLKSFCFQGRAVDSVNSDQYYNLSRSCTLFNKVNEDFLIENRNKTTNLRRAYDSRFGLIASSLAWR